MQKCANVSQLKLGPKFDAMRITALYVKNRFCEKLNMLVDNNMPSVMILYM